MNEPRYLISLIQKEIDYKISFLNHQKRDLPACWPTERDERIKEIESLELELENILNELKQEMEYLTSKIEELK